MKYIDGQPDYRTISVQIENLKKKDCDVDDIASELEDVASNIDYYLEHIENMLAPYKDRIPTYEEVKRNMDIIKQIL